MKLSVTDKTGKPIKLINQLLIYLKVMRYVHSCQTYWPSSHISPPAMQDSYLIQIQVVNFIKTEYGMGHRIYLNITLMILPTGYLEETHHHFQNKITGHVKISQGNF